LAAAAAVGTRNPPLLQLLHLLPLMQPTAAGEDIQPDAAENILTAAADVEIMPATAGTDEAAANLQQADAGADMLLASAGADMQQAPAGALADMLPGLVKVAEDMLPAAAAEKLLGPASCSSSPGASSPYAGSGA
jgi:hypothetical protein